jgi:hypothetical protein
MLLGGVYVKLLKQNWCNQIKFWFFWVDLPSRHLSGVDLQVLHFADFHAFGDASFGSRRQLSYGLILVLVGRLEVEGLGRWQLRYFVLGVLCNNNSFVSNIGML